MRLVRVYEGHGPYDAYLVKHWLESNGIECTIQGEVRLGLQGAIPMHDAWPTLWVSSLDAQRSTDLIEAMDSNDPTAPPWRCAGCGETVDGHFGSCWSCGKNRPDLP